MNHPQHKELQETLNYWFNFAPCLGTNISLYDKQHGYWHAACGHSQIQPSTPLEANERCYIYSITKTFTAIAIMQLVETGKLLLDKPANHYLKQGFFNDITLTNEITIRHLLNHTSGIPSYTDLADYMPATKAEPSNPWSFEDTIQLTLTKNLNFSPGEKWAYSNTGYMLLLLIIEGVSGLSYAEYIDRFIIKKLTLDNTYVAEDIDNGKVTNGYCRYLNQEDKMENITPIYNPWWCKTGLIVSTTSEVTQLYKHLFDGNLVSKNALQEMTTAISIGGAWGPYKKPSYGLGLMIDPEADYGGSYGHGGDGPGFNTYAVYYPNFQGRAVIITIFCNTSMGGHPLYLIQDLLSTLK